MKNIILLLSIVASILTPIYTYAGPILRSGEEVSVDAEQALKGDFYGVGSTVTVSGPADNDVYVGGGSVTINAPVKQDLTIVGGDVQVHGEVADDIRVVGGNVVIAKPVKGDVVVVGGSLTILSTATIEGDVLFTGSDLTVEGEVVGSIHGSVDKVRINAKVGGDISFSTIYSFTLGDKAQILGDITYASNAEMIRAQDASIAGEVHKIPLEDNSTSDILRSYSIFIFIIICTAMTLYILARRRVVEIVTQTHTSIGVQGLVGIIVFLTLPVVSMLCMMTVIGVGVGVMLLLVYIVTLLFSFILSGILCGYYIQYALKKKEDISFITVVLGVIFFLVVVSVPYIGPFILLGTTLILFGKLSIYLYTHIK